MKIKCIARSEEIYSRQTKLDINKIHRNRDPILHPLERAREYTKTLVAVKLDKVFAKPFVGALDGHNDSIHCLSTVRNKVLPLISGSCDGEIKVWDLSKRSCYWSSIAHTGFVRGIAPDESGNSFYSCGDDKLIKQWALVTDDTVTGAIEPLKTIFAHHSLKSIDHHWKDKQYATCGESVCIWDGTRTSSDPVHSYSWGSDSIISVKYNPAEPSLLASTAVDRSVCLYDLRTSVPMRKFLLSMKSNKVAWNPLEPFNFVLANEDHNLYTFDMRNLSKALLIHKDHVGAVTDVSFSPTGREFVSGGYDNTLRIFKMDQGKSREVYHAKRMQHVFAVAYSADSRYVISGSDDTNVRIWRAEASQNPGVSSGREERKLKYSASLKKRFGHLPEINRIIKDKKIPTAVKKAKNIQHIQNMSEHRKQENRKKHSREGAADIEPEKKRAVIKEYT